MTAPNSRLRLPSGKYSSCGSISQATTAAAAVIDPTTAIATVGLPATTRQNSVMPCANRRAAESRTGISIRVGVPLVSFRVGFNNRALRAGIKVIDTNNDRMTAIEIATAISRNSCPASSSIVRIGINTITVVNAETNTAPQTCLVPSRAAFRMDWPCSRRRKMFSSTTIAASTTMPTEKAIPASEITLRDRPNNAIATNAPITDTGIAIVIMIVARSERRKRSKMIPANTPPTQMFCCTSRMAELM